MTVKRAGRVSPGGGMSTCSRARNTTVAEHAPDRLGEAVGGVLGGGLGVGKAAVPGRAAAHGARGEAVDDLDGERCVETAMKTKTSRPL